MSDTKKVVEDENQPHENVKPTTGRLFDASELRLDVHNANRGTTRGPSGSGPVVA